MKRNQCYIILFFILIALGPLSADCSAIVCDDAYRFEVGFDALILQAGASNLHYAAEAIPLPLPSPNWNIFDLHPSHRFGFDLNAQCMNQRSNNFLRINWEHFKSHSSSSL